jgi:hypothetical protein
MPSTSNPFSIASSNVLTATRGPAPLLIPLSCSSQVKGHNSECVSVYVSPLTQSHHQVLRATPTKPHAQCSSPLEEHTAYRGKPYCRRWLAAGRPMLRWILGCAHAVSDTRATPSDHASERVSIEMSCQSSHSLTILGSMSSSAAIES